MVCPSYLPGVAADVYGVPSSTSVSDGSVPEDNVCYEAREHSRVEGPLDDGSAAHLFLHSQVLRALTRSKNVSEATKILGYIIGHRYVEQTYRQARLPATAKLPRQFAGAIKIKTHDTVAGRPLPYSLLDWIFFANTEVVV